MRERVRGLEGVRQRNHPISLAPDDQDGQTFCQVQALLGADGLPSGVHDRTGGAEKRPPGVRVGERAHGPPGFGQSRSVHAKSVKSSGDPVAHRSECGREDEWHDRLEPGEGDQPEHPGHLPPEPARVDEDQAFTTLGELVGELQGDATPVRVPENRHPVEAKDLDEIPRPAGKVAERVVPPRFGRMPVANEVRRNDGEVLLQEGHHRHPALRTTGDPVQQEQRGTGACTAKGGAVTMDVHVLEGDVLLRSARRLEVGSRIAH